MVLTYFLNLVTAVTGPYFNISDSPQPSTLSYIWNLYSGENLQFYEIAVACLLLCSARRACCPACNVGESRMGICGPMGGVPRSNPGFVSVSSSGATFGVGSYYVAIPRLNRGFANVASVTGGRRFHPLEEVWERDGSAQNQRHITPLFVFLVDMLRPLEGETLEAKTQAAMQLYPGGWTYHSRPLTEGEMDSYFFYPEAYFDIGVSPACFAWFNVWGGSGRRELLKIGTLAILPTPGARFPTTVVCSSLHPSFNLPDGAVTRPAEMSQGERDVQFLTIAKIVCSLSGTTRSEQTDEIATLYPQGWTYRLAGPSALDSSPLDSFSVHKIYSHEFAVHGLDEEGMSVVLATVTLSQDTTQKPLTEFTWVAHYPSFGFPSGGVKWFWPNVTDELEPQFRRERFFGNQDGVYVANPPLVEGLHSNNNLSKSLDDGLALFYIDLFLPLDGETWAEKRRSLRAIPQIRHAVALVKKLEGEEAKPYLFLRQRDEPYNDGSWDEMEESYYEMVASIPYQEGDALDESTAPRAAVIELKGLVPRDFKGTMRLNSEAIASITVYPMGEDFTRKIRCDVFHPFPGLTAGEATQGYFSEGTYIKSELWKA